MNTIGIIIVLVFLVQVTGCTEINPAGPGTYTNPTYPDSEKGYFYCGEDPGSCVFAPGTSTVWIAVPSSQGLLYRDVSMAVVNPFLVDTLYLHFTPDLLVAPPSGDHLFVTVSGGNDIFKVDTEELKADMVYSSNTSISTMRISSDGSTLILGSRGSPWHVETVSTDSFEQMAYLETDWPVQRLEVAPDNSLAAISNSGRTDIIILDFSTLVPVDTLLMPMRTGTMSFLQNSTQLVVLDASTFRPYMIKMDLETGEELFRSRPINSYLFNFHVDNTNTLLLPRNQDERVSVLNMENMIFAPSLALSHRIGSVCVSDDGNYIVAVSRTATPGRATVFHYEE